VLLLENMTLEKKTIKKLHQSTHDIAITSLSLTTAIGWAA